MTEKNQDIGNGRLPLISLSRNTKSEALAETTAGSIAVGPVSFPSCPRQTKDIGYKFNVQAALIMEKTATVQTDSDMVCSICI